MIFSVNKLLLTYLYKISQTQNEEYLNTEMTHWKAKREVSKTPYPSLFHIRCVKMYVKNFISEMYHCTKTYHKQQTETIKH